MTTKLEIFQMCSAHRARFEVNGRPVKVDVIHEQRETRTSPQEVSIEVTIADRLEFITFPDEETFMAFASVLERLVRNNPPDLTD